MICAFSLSGTVEGIIAVTEVAEPGKRLLDLLQLLLRVADALRLRDKKHVGVTDVMPRLSIEADASDKVSGQLAYTIILALVLNLMDFHPSVRNGHLEFLCRGVPCIVRMEKVAKLPVPLHERYTLHDHVPDDELLHDLPHCIVFHCRLSSDVLDVHRRCVAFAVCVLDETDRYASVADDEWTAVSLVPRELLAVCLYSSFA